MVIGLATAAIQMGLALPTGFLFGVGYGTGVRIGYEQVYPLLFPKGARPTTTELAATMKGMNTVYDAIGGKDASRMGIAVGITNAGEILNNPDFRVLEQLESSSSGLTSSSSNQSRYGLDNLSSPPPDTSSRTGGDTSYFQSYYQAISSFNLTQTISAYGEATQHKNGFTRAQNNDFLIPALKTRLAQLRDSSSTAPIANTVPTAEVIPAPYRDATTLEQEYNTWAAKLYSLQQTIIKLKRDERNWQAQFLNGNKDITNPLHKSWYTTHQNALASARSQLTTISNDYRNPNNTIRTFALTLRQEIANGTW